MGVCRREATVSVERKNSGIRWVGFNLFIHPANLPLATAPFLVTETVKTRRYSTVYLFQYTHSLPLCFHQQHLVCEFLHQNSKPGRKWKLTLTGGHTQYVDRMLNINIAVQHWHCYKRSPPNQPTSTWLTGAGRQFSLSRKSASNAQR